MELHDEIKMHVENGAECTLYIHEEGSEVEYRFADTGIIFRDYLRVAPNIPACEQAGAEVTYA